MKIRNQEKRTGVLDKCKNAIDRRLEPKQFQDQPKPIMTGQNIHYEMGDETRAMSYGGIGAIHKMVKQIGLDQEIDNRLELLKVHVPSPLKVAFSGDSHLMNIGRTNSLR